MNRLAERIYAILVEEAGAAPSNQWESSFVDWFSKGGQPDEWRFGGRLGFGGKFWKGWSAEGGWHVSCYREDATPERQEIIERTNARLAQLREESTS